MSEQTKTSEEKKAKEGISLDKLINGANWIAIIVVGLSTAMLLLVIAKAVLSNSNNPAPKQIEIKYILKVDSLQLRSFKDSTSITYDKFIRQNNQKVIEEVNNSIKQQYQRMESILSVQEDKGKLFTYGAGFLAILVALATFFGFKSINEMKKGTIESAEYEARKLAGDIAEEKTKEKVRELLEDIRKQITTEIKTEFKGDFERKELIISDQFRQELLQVINKSFENFDERILELESQGRYVTSESEIAENTVSSKPVEINKSEHDNIEDADKSGKSLDTGLFEDDNN